MLKRKDLQIIYNIIEPKSKILDLGCKDGLLLHELTKEKSITGLGIEISMEKIKSCLELGMNVIQEDLNEGLKEFQDKSFDYVVLSQTLEYIANPDHLIQEMLRVGKKCIISFENLAYWKNRITFVLKGTLKRERANHHNLFYGKKFQIITVNKFFEFCKYYKIRICNHFYLPIKRYNLARAFPNIFSKIAIFILKRND